MNEEQSNKTVHADFVLKPRYKHASAWLTTWAAIEKAMREGKALVGTVTTKKHNGWDVVIEGVTTFMPRAAGDESTAYAVGQVVSVNILSMSKPERSIVVTAN